MMNPKKIALFLLSTLLFLFALTFASNRYELEEEDIYGFKVGDWYVRYPTFEKLTREKKIVSNEKASEILDVKKPTEEKKDTIQIIENQEEIFVSNEEGKIYYPGVPQEFVAKLHAKLSQPTCRIIHYGASKDEGDRITSYLRDGLQAIYGGSGPGYFPIKPPYPQKSIEISHSDNWRRYALFNADQRRTKDLLPTNQYGLYANACRFTPAKSSDTTQVRKASFTIKPSFKFYERLRQYTQMGIHYGNCKSPTLISVYQNGNLLRKDSLKTDGKYHHYKLQFDRTPAEIKVELSGRVSPDFYAITLDGQKGIRMDNVPTRGDSGLHFTRLQNTFDQMSKELHPDIFIFEFGGNLVPALKHQEQIKGGVKRIIANMEWVRRRNPEALFILVGPSDMLKKDTMESYPIFPALIAEMKALALEKGFAFWSMYEAMGGNNSMKIWYDKGYGAADFIHFSEKGTEKISELFFKEITSNLRTYQQQEKQKLETQNKEIEEALRVVDELKAKNKSVK